MTIGEIFASDPRRAEVFIGYRGNNLDLTGRLRTSEKNTIFPHVNNTMKNHTMLEKLTGAGTATFNYDKSFVDMTVGTASGDKVTRQSYHYIPYLPGTPVLCKATCVMAPSKENVSQRVGIFDDRDGLFFEDDGTGMNIVIRTSTSGTPDNRIKLPQNKWNIDKLNGRGMSGLTRTSWNEDLFYFIEYLWQGAVGVKFGIMYMGEPILLHTYYPEGLTEPFMAKPNLPVRYEIENTGASASATTMSEGCVDIVSEGGHRLVGSDWSITTDPQEVNVGTSLVPVLVVRLRNTFGTNPVRRILKLLGSSLWASTQDCHVSVAVVHNPTSVTGGAGFVDVDTDHSTIEYNIATTAITITGGDIHYLRNFDVTAKSGGAGFSGSQAVSSRFEDTHSFVSQNIDSDNSDLLVIYARSRETTTNITANMELLEFE